jgi:hypothetical protein
MAISTSAGARHVLNTVEGGLVPGSRPDDIGIGAAARPAGTVPTALVGGASLYVVADGDDVEAAAWDFISYLVSPEVQSLFATLTGYVPVRDDALDVEPVATVYRDDPRFRVAYDQLVASPDSPALQGPILGPQREIRAVTARAVAEIFAGGGRAGVAQRCRAAGECADLRLQRAQLTAPVRSSGRSCGSGLDRRGGPPRGRSRGFRAADARDDGEASATLARTETAMTMLWRGHRDRGTGRSPTS